MTNEERLSKAEELANKLDVVNDLDYAYTEGEDDCLKDSVQSVTGQIPLLWESKSYNRQQCYSIMFSKIFLAYLISEIKDGNILPIEYLEKIKNSRLDSFDEFFYDDCGYANATLLDKMIEQIITKDNIFQINIEYMDNSPVCNTTDNELDEDNYLECEEQKLAEIILETCPKIGKIAQVDKIANELSGIVFYMSEVYEVEIWMEEISSSILYEIVKREELSPTELGKVIVDKYENVLKYTLQPDQLYWGLHWTVLDDEDKVLRFYCMSGSDVMGDDCFYPSFSVERLYEYRFAAIFWYLQLQKEIKKYQKLYLNK